MRKKEFKVADFGAVGDGVTNDGLAICKALSAALQEPDDIQKEMASRHVIDTKVKQEKMIK